MMKAAVVDEWTILKGNLPRFAKKAGLKSVHDMRVKALEDDFVVDSVCGGQQTWGEWKALAAKYHGTGRDLILGLRVTLNRMDPPVVSAPKKAPKKASQRRPMRTGAGARR